MSLESTPYKVSVYGYNYSDNRKTKISESDWTRNSTAGKFADPETVFPEKKISKKSTRKFAKRDMETGITALGGVWSSDGKSAYIPMKGGEVYFLVQRNTMFGVATWTINGTFVKKSAYSFKSESYASVMSLLETEETLELFRSIAASTPEKGKALISSTKPYYQK